MNNMEENNNQQQQVVLVFYINVGNLDREEANAQIQSFKENIDEGFSEFKNIVIPIQNGESKVECINPVLITQEEVINQFKEKVDKLNEYLKEQLENQNNNDDEHEQE